MSAMTERFPPHSSTPKRLCESVSAGPALADATMPQCRAIVIAQHDADGSPRSTPHSAKPTWRIDLLADSFRAVMRPIWLMTVGFGTRDAPLSTDFRPQLYLMF
jgi:hypothetical protein